MWKHEEVGHAARSAFGPSVLLVVVCIPSSLFGLLFRRLKDGHWPRNTYEILGLAIILPVTVFIVVFTSNVVDLIGRNEQSTGTKVVFSGMLWVRLLLVIASAFLIILFVALQFQNAPFRFILLTPLLLYCLFAVWPRPIEFSDFAVRQRGLLFQERRIKFKEIASAYVNARNGYVKIYGKNGTTINCTTLHAHRVQFVERVQQITGRPLELRQNASLWETLFG